MTEPAIELRDLAVRAGSRVVLAIERLAVGRGEFVGLLGPNGAGKTTLLRSCLGMQRHVRGEVRVLGQSVVRLGFRALARLRQRIGYVPQLLPARSEMPLTVREVVAIGRTGVAGLFRRLSRDDWRAVDEWIERLGLSALACRGYGEISGGEQRKTLIARAMVQRPDILLLDEPTANLDLGWRERIVELVGDLYRATTMTVLLVCHELEVLPPGCARVAVLREGRLMAEGPPEDVLTSELLRSMYGPGVAVLHRAGRWAVIPEGAVHA